jgi:hypothetical protein
MREPLTSVFRAGNCGRDWLTATQGAQVRSTDSVALANRTRLAHVHVRSVFFISLSRMFVRFHGSFSSDSFRNEQHGHSALMLFRMNVDSYAGPLVVPERLIPIEQSSGLFKAMRVPTRST